MNLRRGFSSSAISSLFIGQDGRLRGFGGLGFNKSDSVPLTPQDIPIPGSHSILSVGCGVRHFLVLTQDNRIWAWGDNAEGECGLGHEKPAITPPQEVILPDNEKAVRVVAGGSSSGAITRCGNLYLWGKNHKGQLALDDCQFQNTPTKPPNMPPVKDCSLSYGHGMAITKDNRLCLWGSNFDGECGTGDISQSEMPSVLDFPHEITQISCGGFCSFALTKTGDLYGFGWNGFGNLGVGDNSVRKSPVLVSSDVQAIASGDFFSIALLKDGSLCSWGYNDKGQLGLGLGHDSETRPTLVPVSVSEKIIGVGCGGGFSYFVTELGDLYMWGGGAEGKLGSGSTENLFIPTFVRNFKARAPFFDMCEWESFRWLFLGKLDVGCIFSFLPKEVLFHFVQTLGQ